MNLLEAFDSRRVFITGHTGFKGSWLFKALQMGGAETLGYSLRPEDLSHFNQLGLSNSPGAESFGDIRDFELLSKVLKNFQPEIIFHLAAQPIVSESFENPKSTFETNFMGGVNLLDACLDLKQLKCIVFITSDKAYENLEWKYAYRENDRLGGSDPYSASKGAVEIAVSSYKRSFFESKGVQLFSARAGNVIGGGDWSKDRIVPDVIRAISSGNRVELRNPRSTRPWQHVLEPLRGYLSLAERLTNDNKKFSRAWNFGPKRNNYKTVLWIVKFLSKNINNSNYKIKSENFINETKILKINSSDAIKYLGWKNKWEIKETLNQTLDWYMSFESKKNMLDFSIKQIDLYQRL